MASQRKFQNYDEFFAFYVAEHREPMNRMLHALGTFLGLTVIVLAFWFGKPWWALLWIPVAYGFSWSGHFIIEGNKPATFQHPLWSFISDFRMLSLMLTGRLEPWLQRGLAANAASAGNRK